MLQHKRWISAALAAVMALSLTACGSKEQTAEVNENGETEWEASADIFNMDQSEEELYELAKEEG